MLHSHHAIRRVKLAPHLGKRRPFSSKHQHIHKVYFHPEIPPPIRVLGPTLWCFGVAGIIYVGCATYETYQEVQESKRRPGPLTVKGTNLASYGRGTTGTGLLGDLTGAEKALVTIGALNIGIYGAARAVPRTIMTFAHIPTSGRNFTMLTSTFGHFGAVHLALNMFALFSLGHPVAESPTFTSSGSHLTAFYLSTGLFATLGQHLRAAAPRRSIWLLPTLGASGAIMGLFGVWATLYPDNRIGVMLLPGSLTAGEVLIFAIAFDAWGTVFGFPYIKFAHPAHLTGVLAGAAYVHFDGKKRLWQPTKRLAFNSMKRLSMI
ncbi:hypothetical protein HYFRA_00005284 [Hymenoscyphus fraxineus]|uniref:Peptidase S54 rhomboid domain-containing protein n=1 Tax=Hymenoscyphus fraxineus TaxID=746836 RepID=A0A9N9L8G7_9HELO|nr:hypothetical protein HYFRA_00005284 [Hymenoscyphus fraxineus]